MRHRKHYDQDCDQKYDKGFILFEMLVALMLMGVLMYGGMVILSHLYQQKCHQVTEERLVSLMKTLAAYGAMHGRLPWAADARGLEMLCASANQGACLSRRLASLLNTAWMGMGDL